jgi:DNA-binding HxlR family transcriptional regulator
MAKSYDQYCPIAHALDLVGERWALLVVRELLHEGPMRYSDLHARLDGCGTNILAARLKALEQGGVVRRRRLDPPAASWVYELTDYGAGLRDVLHVLAHWGARSLGPPTVAGDVQPGWLPGALSIALPKHTPGTIEFRIGDELASVVENRVLDGPTESPDAIVSGAPPDFYCLMVDRDSSKVSIEGDAGVVHAMLDALPPAGPHVAAGEPATT